MLHPLLQSLFACLCEEKIGWSLLYPASHQDHPGNDITLLIDPKQLHRVWQICEEQGFVRVPGFAPRLEQQFMAYDESTEQCIRLQVVRQVAFGRYGCFTTNATAEYLHRSRQQDSVVALAPNDSFWTLLFHCLLDKGWIAPADREALQRLGADARGEGPLARIVDTIQPGGTSAAWLIDYVRQGDWATLEQHASALAAGWRLHDASGTRRRLLLSRLASLGALLADRRRVHGLSIAVLGPDGAGKSTIAEGIAERFCLPVQTVYMGLWQRRATVGRGLRLPGARFARMAMLVASRPFFIWSRYLTAQGHQTLGRMVIFDRYIYDSLLPPRPPLATVKRPIFWLLAHLCPPPDLVFLLDAPGRMMAERKAEYSAEHLEKERQRFLSLRKQIPKLQVVDASRDLDAVRGDVLRRVWQAYTEHWTPRRKHHAPDA
jgi:thymidylate kinase